MSEWGEFVVQDVAAPIRNALVGGPFGSNLVSTNYVSHGVPVIRGQNMGFRKWVAGGFVFVSEEKARELAANIAKPGDLIFTQRGTLGQIAIVPDGIFDRYIVSQSQMKLTVDPEKADVHFLYYYFSSHEQQAYIRQNSIQTGVPHTNLSILRNTPLYLPPLSEQREIAHILSALDDKIDLNRRMNATLEATARALFQSWFADFDPVRAKAEGRQPEGMDAATAALFPDAFEDSALGWIPSGWRVGKLGEVAENPRRGVNPQDVPVGTLYIGLEHMPQKSLALSEWGTADDVESNKSLFYRGEFLFGKLRPYFHKVGIAPIDGICSTDILVLMPISDSWAGFVLFHISSDALVAHTITLSSGTKMPRTSWHDIAGYSVVLPPENIAAVFSELVSPMIQEISANVHESRTLAETRDALLPKLISGQLRVGG